MNEYISLLIPGFEKVAADALSAHLPGCKIQRVTSGMIHYRYGGRLSAAGAVPFFSNTFLALRVFRDQSPTFPAMVDACRGVTYRFLPRERATFRVRFSRENQFQPVPREVSLRAERAISAHTQLTSNRVNPDHEFWYVVRRESFAFYGFLLPGRKESAAPLQRGELRPEFAYLMCLYSGAGRGDVVCDPFAGSGAIPAQLLRHFGARKAYVSDRDSAKVAAIGKRLRAAPNRLDLRTADAASLSHIPETSVDQVVTDPPWGMYEDIPDIGGLYRGFLAECVRILRNRGGVTVLTAQGEALERAAWETPGLQMVDSLRVLVNGKKAAVYRLRKKL